jgi:hypothetical protein
MELVSIVGEKPQLRSKSHFAAQSVKWPANNN